MQPRTLEQVLASLDSVYNPQVESVRSRQALIPQQIAEEEKGLEAKQGQAFEEIMGGARRRGLGFAGIPLGEQAKYTATEFLPAVARLKQSGREQAMSLEDAILGIMERRNAQGQSIYEGERNFFEQKRQFDEQQRLAREQAAAAARGSATDNSWLGALMGGGKTQQQAPAALQQDEVDSQYIGRLQSLPADQRVQIIAGLRNGAKRGDERSARLFNLGKQLGYWKF